MSAVYVGGTRGSCIVTSAADVLWMSVVRRMQELVEYMRCVCVWLWAESEWMRGLGLGFTNPVGTGGALDVCLCLGCGGVCGEWVVGLDQGLEVWVVLCLGEL